MKVDRYNFDGYDIVKCRGRMYETDDESVRYRDTIEVAGSPKDRTFRVWWNGIELHRPYFASGEQFAAPPETKPPATESDPT